MAVRQIQNWTGGEDESIGTLTRDRGAFLPGNKSPGVEEVFGNDVISLCGSESFKFIRNHQVGYVNAMYC